MRQGAQLQAGEQNEGNTNSVVEESFKRSVELIQWSTELKAKISDWCIFFQIDISIPVKGSAAGQQNVCVPLELQ